MQITSHVRHPIPTLASHWRSQRTRPPFTASPSRRHVHLLRAGGSDVEKKAEEAKKKLDEKKADIKGQLDVMANMTVDGNFEAKEIQENQAKLQESLKDLDKLSDELESAVKAEKNE